MYIGNRLLNRNKFIKSSFYYYLLRVFNFSHQIANNR